MAIDANVLGEVLGEVLGRFETGDDAEGYSTVGRHHRRNAIRIPNKPDWRASRLTAGTYGPDEGLEPLPLAPQLNGGTFTTAFPNITYLARPQRPFKPERLVIQFSKTITAPNPTPLIRAQGIFIGVHLAQVQLAALNLETFTNNAFGVRLSLRGCEAGIDIQIPVFLSTGLVGTDSVTVDLTFLGNSIN
jgi:hypothetical protein